MASGSRPVSELDDILMEQRLSALFQPIVASNNQTIFGYEALIRGPSDSPLHAPMCLFDAASRAGRLVDLELLAREVVIREFGHLQLPGKLFLNITPATVLEPRFKNGQTLIYLEEAGIDPGRVVIELTEQHPVDDYDLMREAVRHYREMGFAVAMDDLGAGYSSLRHWSELRPDYVKIDRYFIQNLHEDAAKRQFVRSILELAHGLGCKVIGEGIETRDEYRALLHMGLELGQGYFFARPNLNPPRSVAKVLENGAGIQRPGLRRFSDTVASLATRVPPVAPQLPLAELAANFHRHPDRRSVAVVRDGRPLGLIHRQELMNVLTSPYGMSLYGRKPVQQFVRRDVLVAQQNMPVEKLSQRITTANDLHGDEDFIITDDAGDYLGIGTLMALLRKITDLQIHNARYANPLTQLPGNVPISEYVDQLLAEQRPFAVAYCDLDHFKAFNDTYGYARGDDVISATARVLLEQADHEHDFVGHVGGDDFIVVFRSGDWRRRCERLLTRFSEVTEPLHDPAHRAAGGIHATDRSGRHVFFRLLSLSVGVVPVRPRQYHNHHEIAAVASEVKRQAKHIEGNAIFVDRRFEPQPTDTPASLDLDGMEAEFSPA